MKAVICGFFLGALLCGCVRTATARLAQPLEDLEVSETRLATVEVLTDHGKFEYHLDNTGQRDVSAALQAIFDKTAALKDASATFIFLPGVYFIDAPITVQMVCVELRGNGHGGQDIHGMNLKSGTIFQFGKNTGPNCISFLRTGHSQSFPAGETPWPYKNCKVAVEGMTFVGHNNTDVDAMRNGCTAVCQGRSMMRSELPTMADFFANSGYATMHFGKWPLGVHSQS